MLAVASPRLMLATALKMMICNVAQAGSICWAKQAVTAGIDFTVSQPNCVHVATQQRATTFTGAPTAGLLHRCVTLVRLYLHNGFRHGLQCAPCWV